MFRNRPQKGQHPGQHLTRKRIPGQKGNAARILGKWQKMRGNIIPAFFCHKTKTARPLVPYGAYAGVGALAATLARNPAVQQAGINYASQLGQYAGRALRRRWDETFGDRGFGEQDRRVRQQLEEPPRAAAGGAPPRGTFYYIITLNPTPNL